MEQQVVSFCVIAYNEEATLPGLLNDLQQQTYPKELIEVVLVDGGSTDLTQQVMRAFATENHGYRSVSVHENKNRTQPAGWNVALEAASGDVILRVDAHASIPPEFIQKNMDCIVSGEDVCGGYRPNIIDEDTPWKQTVLMAESSMFGSGIAPYRRNTGKHYVKSVFHGAYRKEIFAQVGGFNERLVRTEDNEMHYRIREQGYQIRFDPQIISYQHTRNNFRKMLRQKFLNGYWIGRTVWISPKCLEYYHFAPFVFILSAISTCILAALGFPQFTALLGLTYALLCTVMAALSIIKKEQFHVQHLLLPILFFFLHISYGIGTLLGLIRVRRN